MERGQGEKSWKDDRGRRDGKRIGVEEMERGQEEKRLKEDSLPQVQLYMDAKYGTVIAYKRVGLDLQNAFLDALKCFTLT